MAVLSPAVHVVKAREPQSDDAEGSVCTALLREALSEAQGARAFISGMTDSVSPRALLASQGTAGTQASEKNTLSFLLGNSPASHTTQGTPLRGGDPNCRDLDGAPPLPPFSNTDWKTLTIIH